MQSTLQDEHLPGSLNIKADALSRLIQDSSVPICWQVHLPVKDDSWVLGTAATWKKTSARVASRDAPFFFLTYTTQASLRFPHCNRCFAVTRQVAAMPKWRRKRCTLDLASRIRSHSMPRSARKHKPQSPRHRCTSLNLQMLCRDLTCSPLQLPLPAGQQRPLRQLEWTRPSFRGWV